MKVGSRCIKEVTVKSILGKTNYRYLSLVDEDGQTYEWQTARWTKMYETMNSNADKKFKMSFTIENILEGVYFIAQPRLLEVS